jgi:hypothetical protein
MTDLAGLVPSRDRPQNVERLGKACARTCRADTLLHFGFDEDDPQLPACIDAASPYGLVTVEPRMGLAGWTNRLAFAHVDSVPHLASLGDDMVPVTDGWDVRLIEAAGPAGMAYCDDKRRTDIPELIVMASPLVKALGWMCEPSLEHWFVDNVWRDLGAGAGCLAYLPDVVVEHRHPNMPGGDPADQTYWDASPKMAADMAAYQRWRLKRMRDDVETVRRAGRPENGVAGDAAATGMAGDRP